MAKKKDEKDVLIVRDEKTGEISVVAGLQADGIPRRTPPKNKKSALGPRPLGTRLLPVETKPRAWPRKPADWVTKPKRKATGLRNWAIKRKIRATLPKTWRTAPKRSATQPKRWATKPKRCPSPTGSSQKLCTPS